MYLRSHVACSTPGPSLWSWTGMKAKSVEQKCWAGSCFSLRGSSLKRLWNIHIQFDWNSQMIQSSPSSLCSKTLYTFLCVKKVVSARLGECEDLEYAQNSILDKSTCTALKPRWLSLYYTFTCFLLSQVVAKDSLIVTFSSKNQEINCTTEVIPHFPHHLKKWSFIWPTTQPNPLDPSTLLRHQVLISPLQVQNIIHISLHVLGSLSLEASHSPTDAPTASWHCPFCSRRTQSKGLSRVTQSLISHVHEMLFSNWSGRPEKANPLQFY